MTNDINPYCKRCGFRMFPQWGEHDCISPPDVPRLRHVAGDILSNLHSYRVPVELQLGALWQALAFTFAGNCMPARIEAKMRNAFADVLAMTKRQAGLDPRLNVRDLKKNPRLKAKVRHDPTRAKKVSRKPTRRIARTRYRKSKR